MTPSLLAALAFAVHVGDITSGTGPCGDEWMDARKKQFSRFTHPFVLLPGDNDWTDCHRTGFDPLERLASWRARFCFRLDRISLERQEGKYCENVRWIHDDVVFVGLNVTGSNNNLNRDPLEHGDTHEYRDDEPLPGLLRVQVHGSPHIRWTKARIERAGARLFDASPAPVQ